MKKIYLLAATALIAFSANAQFTDDLEARDLGPLHDAHWDSWSGAAGGEDVIVNANEANDGAKSVVINTAGQDALLTTGGAATESGVWTMAFAMKVASGKTGYFNIQGDDTPGATFMSGNITFAADGTGADSNGAVAFTYPNGEWMDVQIIVDMDDETYNMKVNGADALPAVAFSAPSAKFASLDLFFSTPDDEFYLDSVQFVEGAGLGADEFSGDVFSVYPNPVVSTLNIKSATAVDNVTIYDVLGKQVLSVNPDAISPSVDMSNLSSGAYLVNVTIGNASKTIKVLK